MMQLIPAVARQWESNEDAIISQAAEIEEAV